MRFCLQSLRLRLVENPQPQQINIGPAKHLPLGPLHPVDVPLDRAAPPGEPQPRFHCLVGVSQAVSKASKSRQTTLDRSLQPGLKPCRLALTYELGKTLAQIDGYGSLGVLLM